MKHHFDFTVRPKIPCVNIRYVEKVRDFQRSKDVDGAILERYGKELRLKELTDFLTIAHRGYSGKFPENTIIAFEKAISAGVDALEMDLQLSCDGHVVVIHDEFLDRLAGEEGFVLDKTLDELKALDVGSWMGPEFTGARIPTFREVCEKFARQSLFVLELKTKHQPYPGLVEKTLEIIAEFKLENQAQIVSFNPNTIAEVSKLAPHIRTGFNSKRVENIEKHGLSCGAHEICAFRKILDHDLAKKIRNRGKEVKVWTVDDEEEMQAFLRMDVKGICTNHPPRLIKLL